jgi:hypothetical protein
MLGIAGSGGGSVAGLQCADHGHASDVNSHARTAVAHADPGRYRNVAKRNIRVLVRGRE